MPSQAKLGREYRGTKCHCGQRKRQRVTLCKECYFTLSPILRGRLYQGGEGYADAYQDAVEFLKQDRASKGQV